MEKAGIPSVLIEFGDQDEMAKQKSLACGVPTIRKVIVARTGDPTERVRAIEKQIIGALTDPLTQEEQRKYRYTAPHKRYIFTGTMSQAREFFHQTIKIMACNQIEQYGDGLPIELPTEEAVQAMLKGTSHKPNEIVSLQEDKQQWKSGANYFLRKKGEPVEMEPMKWHASVEAVAANAVMAGCKPEYLPVLLAIAESGIQSGTTTFWSMWEVVSGPIAKEIGMNYGTAAMDPGNPANATIGRATQLMAINLGGATIGLNRMTSIGSPFNTGGTCFAENIWALPPGWKGLNEEAGYSKNDSVVLAAFTPRGITGDEFSPSSYRSLQDRGTGGMAERLGVVGKKGPHNWMQYLLPGIYANTWMPAHFIMVPRMAMDLYNAGFKSKEDVYKWWFDNAKQPMKEFKKQGWYDAKTAAGEKIEPTSGKKYKDLPDDFMIPLAGEKPMDNMIIVAGTNEEINLTILGENMRPNIMHIDPWR